MRKSTQSILKSVPVDMLSKRSSETINHESMAVIEGEQLSKIQSDNESIVDIEN